MFKWIEEKITAIIMAIIAILVFVALGLAAQTAIIDHYGDMREAEIGNKYEELVKTTEAAADAAKLENERKVNEIEAGYLVGKTNTANTTSRIARDDVKLRKPADVAGYANKTSKTLSIYAEEVNRDFGECRERLVEVAGEGAGASDAAWALIMALDSDISKGD